MNRISHPLSVHTFSIQRTGSNPWEATSLDCLTVFAFPRLPPYNP